ncbi:LPXTG cell wall anchor domain-containing protein [Lactococcus lactis]
MPVQPHNTGKNLPTTGEKSGRFLTVIGGLAIIGVLGMTYEVLKRRKTE